MPVHIAKKQSKIHEESTQSLSKIHESYDQKALKNQPTIDQNPPKIDLGGLLEPLGDLLDTSRSPLGRSRSFLGRSWSLLGHSWQPWSAHESSWQANIRALGSLQSSKWPPKGLPRVPQMLPRGLTKDSRSTEILVQAQHILNPSPHTFLQWLTQYFGSSSKQHQMRAPC